MSSPVGSLLLLGASGDLASRLLMPALGQLFDLEPERRSIVLIGVGADDLDDQAWRDRVRTSFARAKVTDATVDAVLATTRYHRADVTDAEDLARLIAAATAAPALYFALPPAVTERACVALADVTLPAGTLLVLEKPFGTDQTSAAALNEQLATLVPEDQIHRVDHFLGRSTVLNLLGLRFANLLFQLVWDADHIDRVDITFDEQLTLENRAGYYDSAGALTDMIQSHLLQILALVTMEPVSAVDATELREAKAEVLRACRVWGDDPVAAGRRARYTTGSVDGRQVPDYIAEPGVDPRRNTETLAELTVQVDTPRWRGVPFRLRSGKALGELRKEVMITFRQRHDLPRGLTGSALPTQLRLTMGPDRMALEINVNGPDDPLELDRVSLDSDLSPGRLAAYGEVLAGVLDSDPLLAVRGDTAEQCWRIVDPVLQAWRTDHVPLEEYAAGSSGPDGWR